MRKQALATVISISLALSLANVAQALAQPSPAPSSGFYGGVSMRDRGNEGQGLTFGPAPLFITRFSASTGDETSSRSLLFGGFRFSNDVSVEASFGSNDKYSLRPADTSTPRGVGLNLATGARSLTELPARSWNVDVLTSWSFLRSFSLYGRLGYVQSDPQGLAAPTINVADPRRLREGVNYGVGLRYDVSSSLGLKLEYSRFGGRFAGEFSSVVPESDQLSVGLQLRF